MKKAIFIIIALLILLPALCFAADIRNSYSDSINIGKDEKPKNLYVAGGTINSEADVLGDMVAAGSTINVNGNVENSLLAAGKDIFIRGFIGNNARVAGKEIYVDGNIGQDVNAACDKLMVGKKSTINGDLMAVANTIEIDGKVLGNVRIGAVNKLIIRGEIKGDVLIKAVNNLVVENSGSIGGKLSYRSPREAEIANASKIAGGINFTKEERFRPHRLFQFLGGLIVWKMIVNFIVLILMVYLLPKFSRNTIEKSYASPIGSFGWGLFTLIIMPIIGIFLLISLVGIPLAGILYLLYVLLLFIAGVYTSLLIGSLILKMIQKTEVYKADWLAALIGVIGTEILLFIPLLGWIIIVIMFLFALGGLTIKGFEALKNQRD